MTKPRGSAQNYHEGIHGFKDEINGVKKKPESQKKETKKTPEPVKDGKSNKEDELMDEITTRRESLRLAEVDAKAKRFHLNQDSARKRAKFTPFKIKQIMIYREEQEKARTPSLIKRAWNATVKFVTPEPTAEERRRILVEKKAFYNDIREKYGLRKKR